MNSLVCWEGSPNRTEHALLPSPQEVYFHGAGPELYPLEQNCNHQCSTFLSSELHSSDLSNRKGVVRTLTL